MNASKNKKREAPVSASAALPAGVKCIPAPKARPIAGGFPAATSKPAGLPDSSQAFGRALTL